MGFKNQQTSGGALNPYDIPWSRSRRGFAARNPPEIHHQGPKSRTKKGRVKGTFGEIFPFILDDFPLKTSILFGFSGDICCFISFITQLLNNLSDISHWPLAKLTVNLARGPGLTLSE